MPAAGTCPLQHGSSVTSQVMGAPAPVLGPPRDAEPLPGAGLRALVLDPWGKPMGTLQGGLRSGCCPRPSSPSPGVLETHTAQSPWEEIGQRMKPQTRDAAGGIFNPNSAPRTNDPNTILGKATTCSSAAGGCSEARAGRGAGCGPRASCHAQRHRARCQQQHLGAGAQIPAESPAHNAASLNPPIPSLRRGRSRARIHCPPTGPLSFSRAISF